MALVYSAFFTQHQVSHTIEVKSQADFKIYQDESCTIEITAIDWDGVARASTYNKVAWIKNIGMSLLYVNWNTTQNRPINGLMLNMFFYPDGVTQVEWNYQTRRIELTASPAPVKIVFQLVIASDAPFTATSITQNFGAYDTS
jgi:hypothetical protein